MGTLQTDQSSTVLELNEDGTVAEEFDAGFAEGKWTTMDASRESQKDFCADSTRQLASLGRSESAGREHLWESDCVRAAVTGRVGH